MPIIKAQFNTRLKRRNLDSSQLDRAEYFEIQAGATLAGELYDVDRHSMLIELAGNAGLLKQGERWFIYKPHWQLPQAAKFSIPSSQIIRKIVPSKRDYDAQDTEYTCQAAAISMITGGDEMTIRNALMNMGSAGDPAVMGRYLKDRVKEYRFKASASLTDFVEAIDNNYQLISHGWLSRSGHVIKISGYELDLETMSYIFICDDPYEAFDAKIWDYHRDYRSGNNARYDARLMYAAFVKGRSFEDARHIYRRGELDLTDKGAWLHLVD